MLIRLDRVGAFNHIENVVIPANGVINGSLLQLDAQGTNFGTINGIEITDITADLVMIVEEFMNLTGIENETNMTFNAGDVRRGYHFLSNDKITVTIDGITGANNTSAMVGQYVIPVVGSYLGKISSTASGSLCFKVVANDTLDHTDALVLQVI